MVVVGLGDAAAEAEAEAEQEEAVSIVVKKGILRGNVPVLGNEVLGILSFSVLSLLIRCIYAADCLR